MIETLHLFPSHSCSPGDLAAKGKGENNDETLSFSNWTFKVRNDEVMEKVAGMAQGQ